MQISITNIVDKIFVLITGLFLIGCASDPVPTYLPSSHPAHPEAAEVVYTATPDPFQNGTTMTDMQSDKVPHTPPSAQGEGHSHRMTSGGHKHEKAVGTETEKTDHQHKEHK